MITFYDQLGRDIHLQAYPQRIISTVPSQTELLFDLGLTEEVVGITKFCMHPEEWFRNKTRVGGTKVLKMETIHSLQPDLIIANKEENTKEQIEELSQRYPVWISDISDLATALKMIVSIGEVTGKLEKAKELGNQITNAFNSFKDQLLTESNQPKTAYLIWKDPYMTVGSETFIDSMLKICGLRNIFDHLTRYPEITIEHLQPTENSRSLRCELLLLSSEPYPFNEKHILELKARLPGTKIMLVDGEMFSWYGSRLLYAADYFKKMLAEVHSS
jgi:ABC-type Fe3+-hydroxamate transport system substrate-binding protein